MMILALLSAGLAILSVLLGWWRGRLGVGCSLGAVILALAFVVVGLLLHRQSEKPPPSLYGLAQDARRVGRELSIGFLARNCIYLDAIGEPKNGVDRYFVKGLEDGGCRLRYGSLREGGDGAVIVFDSDEFQNVSAQLEDREILLVFTSPIDRPHFSVIPFGGVDRCRLEYVPEADGPHTREVADAAPTGGPKLGQDWVVPGLEMEFVWIPMLRLWVGRSEVTNREYRLFDMEHSSRSFSGHSLNAANQPVVYINLRDAQSYACWLTNRERQAQRLAIELEYRLPTGKEWALMARCGTKQTYYWGDDLPPTYGNFADGVAERAFGWKGIVAYRDGHAVTAPVEASGRNTWGLLGVGGNVWEATVSEMDLRKFAGWRGGGWRDELEDRLRCDYRILDSGLLRHNDCGFRLVLAPIRIEGVESGQTGSAD